MRKVKSFKRAIPGLAAAAALAMGLPVASAGELGGAGDFKFAVSGYLRAWVSLNLENQPELKAKNQNGNLNGDPNSTFDYDSKWDASMVRGSALLDLDASYMGLKFKTIARLDREYKTDYLKKLEQLRGVGQVVNTDGAAAAALRGQGYASFADSIMDNYNHFDFREWWVEAPIGDRITIKAGRQQLVWGESDFFHAMDVVHGYDFSWRLFFEGENEEWRKPLILISTKIQVPEANGALTAFIRPGWDRCSDIGNTYDVNGGRWFLQPYRGFNLSAIAQKNCDQKNWDKDDVTGGIRWQGEAFDLNYSLAYINTFSADPVANPNQDTSNAFASAGFGTDNGGRTNYKNSRVHGQFFDWIHPKIDVLGATLSGYSAFLDAVLSAEASYTIDQPYNFGTGQYNVPNKLYGVGNGLGGIKTKDVVNVMLRMDKNLNFQDTLGTSRPSFSSIQLFDTMVVDYKGRKDDLVRLFAFGDNLKEHNTILTAFTVLNYMNDKINPSFVLGFDLGNGGGFAIPAVAFTLNDNWVGKVEADIFWSGGKSSTSQFGLGAGGQKNGPESQLFGWFEKNSQLVFRLTRQF